MNEAENTIIVRRSYLLTKKSLKRLQNFTPISSHTTTEVYYDTRSQELSSAECILMKDTDSENYWKFFSYASDNIMEITTDEKDIREPLSRLLPYEMPCDINKHLLVVSYDSN